jgi:hypothetical protein
MQILGLHILTNKELNRRLQDAQDAGAIAVLKDECRVTDIDELHWWIHKGFVGSNAAGRRKARRGFDRKHKMITEVVNARRTANSRAG